jgi:hypothetical protein
MRSSQPPGTEEKKHGGTFYSSLSETERQWGNRQGVLNMHSAETEEFMTGGTLKEDNSVSHICQLPQ